MNILLISPLPPPYGGISHWTVLVAEYAKKSGDNIEIINTAPSKRGVDGRTMPERIIGGLLGAFRCKKMLKEKIKSFFADMAHLSTSGSLSFVRDYILIKYLKKRKIRMTYHLHFGKIPAIKEKNNWEWKLFLKNASMVDYIVAMNNYTYEALQNVIPVSKLYNIANPIDTTILPDIIEYKFHEKFIFYLGWVQKTKGIEELLWAWQEIKKEFPEWNLKLAGPVNDEYKQYLAINGLCEDVEFLGELPHKEAMEYMKKAGLFVLPSYSEGFPNVILEAMALKVPVLATDVGAIPQMLNGNGTLVAVKDRCDIKNKLIEILPDEACREKCATDLYNHMKNNYDISLVYSEYKKIWKGLM